MYNDHYVLIDTQIVKVSKIDSADKSNLLTFFLSHLWNLDKSLLSSSFAQGAIDLITFTSIWDVPYLLLYVSVLFMVLWTLMTVVCTPKTFAYICFKGSKTFFFASLFYPLPVRNRIFIFYAFARLGDDLIDDYKGEQQEKNLSFLQRILDYWYTHNTKAQGDIFQEIKSMLCTIPILPDTFTKETIETMILSLDTIISNCEIPRWAFELLLWGFKMDTESVNIRNEDDLLTYCICVASSIGMVCTCLYQDGTMKVDETLLSNAASLGIAFQLTNISRDIITDLVDPSLSRIYVPRSWMNEEQYDQFQAMLHGNCDIEKHRNELIRDYAVTLIQIAEIYYADAWEGISGLPEEVQFAIYSALLIYREIGMGILRKKTYPTRSFTTLKDKILLILKRDKPQFVINDALKAKNRSWEMLQKTIDKIGRAHHQKKRWN